MACMAKRGTEIRQNITEQTTADLTGRIIMGTPFQHLLNNSLSLRERARVRGKRKNQLSAVSFITPPRPLLT
jgi:hypothetical protein